MGNLSPIAILGLLLLVALVVFTIWLAIWIGKKAEEKGYSRLGFTIFGLFFTLIALIVVLVIQPTQATQAVGSAKCPFCAEAIQPEAKVCKHCGRDIPALTQT